MGARVNDTMRVVLSACLSTIATGAAAWLAFGANTVSRAEVERMLGERVEGSAMILQTRIAAEEVSRQRLEASVVTLIEAQQELLVEQRVLVERVDNLVRQLGGGR